MESTPQLPVAISLVGNKFLIFEVDVVTYLRRVYHICGVMTGTLPQNPSQNLFLGLPMQIMPEEAQLLIEKGVGYLLDDPRAHDHAMRNFDSARHANYMANVKRKAEQAGKIRTGLKEEQKKVALSKQKEKKSTPDKDSVGRNETVDALRSNGQLPEISLAASATSTTETQSESLFVDETESVSRQIQEEREASKAVVSMSEVPLITPTSSALLLNSIPTTPNKSGSASDSNGTNASIRVPNLPASYPLYRHLNSKDYYMTPGLRFGCQYSVYPGDPLRYHSHFLAVSYEWDEEIDLMDIIGGGRLGTGVKKGWLIGGEERGEEEQTNSGSTSTTFSSLSVSFSASLTTSSLSSTVDGRIAEGTGSETKDGDDVSDKSRQKKLKELPRVRTFTVEWAAM